MVSMATKKKFGSFTSKVARWRIWIQAAFLGAWLDPMLTRMHTVCSPVFHCHSCPWAMFACPIGVMANFSALHLMPYLAIGTLVIIGTFGGTFVCGWVCPFGFLQDLIGRIPTPKFDLPARMGYLRYLVLLGVVVVIPYLYGEDHPLFFCRVCPAGALEAALPNTVATMLSGEAVIWPSVAKAVILNLTLLAMFFVRRPWCALFCPLGAIYSLLNHVSFFFLRFQPERCDDCGLCNGLCRYGGPTKSRTGDQRCIRCLDCTSCHAITIGTVFGRSQVNEQNKSESSPT